MSVKQAYLKSKAAAQAALKKDLSPINLKMEQKKIKEAGGMKYSYQCINRRESLFTVGGSKVLHKQTGGDKFSQQARYAWAMR